MENTSSSTEKMMKSLAKEKHYKRAVSLYRKNKAIYLALKGFRKQYSLQETRNYVISHSPKAKVSRTNLFKWKEECAELITDNHLFHKFLIEVGIDPKENNKQRNHKKKAIKQKEKNDRLKEEMEKAKLVLIEMNNPDLSESEKWEISSRGRRQVDKINKEIAHGGLPKVDGVLELFNINGKILAKGKEIVLEKLGTLNVNHMSELKALSDILDTAFKQNRLIEGKSTDNIAIGVNTIYDKIIENADKNKEKSKPGK